MSGVEGVMAGPRFSILAALLNRGSFATLPRLPAFLVQNLRSLPVTALAFWSRNRKGAEVSASLDGLARLGYFPASCNSWRPISWLMLAAFRRA